MALNADQIKGLVKVAGPFIGGVAVGKGFLTNDQVTQLINEAPGFISAIGAAITALTGVWTVLRNSTKGQITHTIALPDVTKIEATPAIANAIPSKDVVPTGTGASK